MEIQKNKTAHELGHVIICGLNEVGPGMWVLDSTARQNLHQYRKVHAAKIRLQLIKRAQELMADQLDE